MAQKTEPRPEMSSRPIGETSNSSGVLVVGRKVQPIRISVARPTGVFVPEGRDSLFARTMRGLPRQNVSSEHLPAVHSVFEHFTVRC